uniref:ARAD1B11968p n=1 Tax=Blastobotrys adeninivorans TaxID=409370 RepID=A0A060T5J0_BLAAD
MMNRLVSRPLARAPWAMQSGPRALARSMSGGSNMTFFQRQSLPANTVIRFVPQQTAWVVERMGKFSRILEPGLAILVPFIDRIKYVKSLKESAVEIPSQSAITADNVTLALDGVLYIRVFDAYKASYGVEDAEYAVAQLAQTTMRSEIGQLTLDHVLRERQTLNANITAAINDAAQAWGVTCLRYEIRDIHPPANVLEAMHRQVSAERAKRAEILESEGHKTAAINRAEGAAEGIRRVAEAIKQTPGGSDAVALQVAEKYVDAFGNLAKESNTVVVPADLGNMSSLIAGGLKIYEQVQNNTSRSSNSSSTSQKSAHNSQEFSSTSVDADPELSQADTKSNVL